MKNGGKVWWGGKGKVEGSEDGVDATAVVEVNVDAIFRLKQFDQIDTRNVQSRRQCGEGKKGNFRSCIRADLRNSEIWPQRRRLLRIPGRR